MTITVVQQYRKKRLLVIISDINERIFLLFVWSDSANYRANVTESNHA